MPNTIKTGIVALCDNVYKDAQSNKAILAGMYSGDVVVEQLPLELRFSLYTELYLPDTADHNVELRFYAGSQLRGGAHIVASANQTKDPVSLIIPQVGLPIAEPTIFELRCILDGGEEETLLRKEITLRSPDSTASQQPS